MAITVVPKGEPTQAISIELPSETQTGDLAVIVYRGTDGAEPISGWTVIPVPWWKRLWWKITNGEPIFMAVKVVESDNVPSSFLAK